MPPQDAPYCSVKDAARQLGISPEAVRKRLDRGTLQGIKRGRVWLVSLPARDGSQDAPQEAVIARLESEVSFLRDELASRTEENRRKDHIIAGLVERMPALSPGETPPGAHERAPVSDVPPVKAPETLVGRVRRWMRRQPD